MSGHGIGFARDPGALDPEAVGAEAAARALALRGAGRATARRCAVVLDAFAAAAMVGLAGDLLLASAVEDGGSPFAGRVGAAVAGLAVGLTDDATRADGAAGAPFDGECAPARRSPLIEDGRLTGYLYDSRCARRAGRADGGNAQRINYRFPPAVGTSNLVLETGSSSLEALFAAAGDGIYLADASATSAGGLRGDGRLIRGGEPAEPVRDMVLTADLLPLLGAVAAVGSAARWLPIGGTVRAAPVLLGDVAVAGT
jgi:PmbA protein